MCNLRACCYEIRLYLIPPCDGNCIRCKGAQDSSWSARGTPDGDVERLAKSTVVREVVVGQCRSSCVAGYHGDP